MFTFPYFVRITLVAVSTLVLAAGTVRSQEVQWRHDYDAARKEALDKNRPLLVDFGTPNCFWCRQLDALRRADS